MESKDLEASSSDSDAYCGKNRLLFWTCVAEDIARILIEIKVGEPLTPDWVESSLHFGSDSLALKVSAFALSTASWIELDSCFFKLVEAEKTKMHPLWRFDPSRNPTAEDDPLRTYREGSALIEVMQKRLEPFLVEYLGLISEGLLTVFTNMSRNKVMYVYRLVFRLIRFLYCNYYLTTIDNVNGRGPCIRYGLMLNPEVQNYFREMPLAPIMLNPFSAYLYLYGDASWMSSIEFWQYYPPFRGLQIPYSKMIFKQVVPWRFPSNGKFVTFAKQTGSVLWLNEGCTEHANAMFATLSTEQESYLQIPKEVVMKPQNISVVPLRTLEDCEEILLQSRLYDQSPDDSDDFAHSSLEEPPSFYKIDLTRISDSSIYIHLIMHENQEKHNAGEEEYIYAIHWGYMRFDLIWTVADGNCFYDALLQTLDQEHLQLSGFLLPEQPRVFKEVLFEWLQRFYADAPHLIKWLLDQLCIELDGCTGLTEMIVKYSAGTKWGGDAFGTILSILLKTNIVFISARDGSFLMTAKVIQTFVSGSKPKEQLSEEECTQLSLVCREYFLNEKAHVFLLHCNSNDPCSVGKHFQEQFGALGVLDHYIGLSLAEEMGTIDCLELQNHLYLMRQLLFDASTSKKRRWKYRKPSQNCVPGKCKYYNKP